MQSAAMTSPISHTKVPKFKQQLRDLMNVESFKEKAMKSPVLRSFASEQKISFRDVEEKTKIKESILRAHKLQSRMNSEDPILHPFQVKFNLGGKADRDNRKYHSNLPSADKKRDRPISRNGLDYILRKYIEEKDNTNNEERSSTKVEPTPDYSTTVFASSAMPVSNQGTPVSKRKMSGSFSGSIVNIHVFQKNMSAKRLIPFQRSQHRTDVTKPTQESSLHRTSVSQISSGSILMANTIKIRQSMSDKKRPHSRVHSGGSETVLKH